MVQLNLLLGEYFFLYLAVFGELPNFGVVDLAIYVTDSIDNGVKSMRKNLEYRWANSEFYRNISLRLSLQTSDGNLRILTVRL